MRNKLTESMGSQDFSAAGRQAAVDVQELLAAEL